jgi:hypothetical protein
MVEQHHAHRADHLPVGVAQRQAADEEGARLVGEQVHEDGHAAVDDLRHQRVGHDLLDTAADEVGLLVAQRGQEALVAVADPDDPVVAVDHHHPHGRAGEGVEHALRRQLEQAVGVRRQRRGRGCLLRVWHGIGTVHVCVSDTVPRAAAAPPGWQPGPPRCSCPLVIMNYWL